MTADEKRLWESVAAQKRSKQTLDLSESIAEMENRLEVALVHDRAQLADVHGPSMLLSAGRWGTEQLTTLAEFMNSTRSGSKRSAASA
eukprot:5301397-Amphidinium_carterae.1